MSKAKRQRLRHSIPLLLCGVVSIAFGAVTLVAGGGAGAGLLTARGQDAEARAIQLHRAGNHAAEVEKYFEAPLAGTADADYQLGWHYEYGLGLPKNLTEAARRYRLAAERGKATAMKCLGQLYEEGKGVLENWIEAAKWYQKSAELADPYGEAALANAYQFGIGVPQNRKLAILWHQRAAAAGIAESARFARWLQDPTNNIGFRNQEEHALVINNQLRSSSLLVGGDPTGITFRNSMERVNWLRGIRNRLDWEACRAKGWSCGPPPR